MTAPVGLKSLGLAGVALVLAGAGAVLIFPFLMPAETVRRNGQSTDTLAADAAVNPEVFGDADDRELFTIRCAAMVLNGQNDLAAARARAYALLAACGAVVRADRRLSGTVGDSHIGTHTLRQTQTPDGTVATVAFTVACDTFTGT